MKKLMLLMAVLLLSISLFSQTRIKTMFYNLYIFGASSTKTSTIIPIINDYQPDLLMVAELTQESAATNLLNNGLNLNNFGITYSMPAIYNNNSSLSSDYEQFVFFNATKLQFVKQTVYQTITRDINHFTFQIITPELVATPTFIEVFVAHLTPSDDADGRAGRLQNAQVFVEQLNTLKNNNLGNSYVLFAGDFNFYKSTELGYIELLKSDNPIVMKDPINMPGDWTNNELFKSIHTQNPKAALDDRFDFILTSENLLNSNSNLTYVPNSYKAYGNNGNCFDIAINNINCSGTYSQTIRDALFAFSDHLPVVMELETKAVPLSVTQYQNNFINFASSNITSTMLNLNINDQLINANLIIYNQLGQIVKTIPVNYKNVKNQQIPIDVNMLSNGVYFMNVKDYPLKNPLKFIKN